MATSGVFSAQLLLNKEIFSQFGQVKRVRLVRNKKGHHTGVAFVEFTSADVAKIAAQTMDNYLLAENRLRCRLIVKQEDLPNSIRGGKLFKPTAKPGENRKQNVFRIKTKLFA